MKTARKKVQFISVEIKIDGPVDLSLINLGAATLTRNGREAVLDSIETEFYDEEDGTTTVVCKVEEDEEIFDDCKYDLTDEDYMSDDLEGTFFFGTEENNEGIEYEPESMTLFIQYDGGLTKAINLLPE